MQVRKTWTLGYREKLECFTWKGHDFLDAAKDDTLWNKAKEKFLIPGVSFTFDILFQWLKSQI